MNRFSLLAAAALAACASGADVADEAPPSDSAAIEALGDDPAENVQRRLDKAAKDAEERARGAAEQLNGQP